MKSKILILFTGIVLFSCGEEKLITSDEEKSLIRVDNQEINMLAFELLKRERPQIDHDDLEPVYTHISIDHERPGDNTDGQIEVTFKLKSTEKLKCEPAPAELLEMLNDEQKESIEKDGICTNESTKYTINFHSQHPEHTVNVRAYHPNQNSNK